ncbi:COP23 domain-containing protein [Pseudanabaena sp. lw0831]|uniref:COP23 domain-containing protein n=1 Tax=Pseudanabaena sp. lw0831 TaxID=1357935 RepID=UPI001915E2F0|nr:COP23 domain-containing protein [Pseudanabaena sp. lw0831]
MKRWIAGFSATFMMALSGLMPEHGYSQADAAKRIYCGRDGDTPTTIIDNGSRIVGLVRWTRDFSPASEWTPQRRCEQVSKKFAENQESGKLVEIVPAIANGLPVLCAFPGRVDSANYICPDAQILIVLRSEDDASNFIDRLWERNTEKSSHSIQHSSGLSRVNGTSNLNFRLLIRYAISISRSSSGMGWSDLPSIQKTPSNWGTNTKPPARSTSSEEKVRLTEQDKQVTFACVATDKTITTVVRTSNRDIPIITWTSKIFSSDWTPEKRCQQVTRKFENLRQKNALKYITTSVVNGSPVICAVKTVNESCTDEEILITLKDRSEAQKVLDQMFLSNSDIPVDDNGVGKRDGRDSVCMSRSASGNCSGLLISAIEL